MSKFKPGDNAYIHDNATGWVQVKILRSLGNYYTVKRLDKSSAFGAAEHRLLTEAEYGKIEKPTYFQPPKLH